MNATDTLRNAVALVRGDPSGVAAIEAEDKQKRDAADAEARRVAELREKVDKLLPARIEQAIQRRAELWRQAEHNACARKERRRLELELGLIPAEAIALSGYPGLVSAEDIQAEFKILSRGAVAQDAARLTTQATRYDSVAARIAQRREELRERAARREDERHARRQRENEARKQAAGLRKPKANERA